MERINIVACLLKCGIAKPEETVVAISMVL
jgi:hypothetical protein